MPLSADSVTRRSVSCFACSCRLLQCAFLRRSASTPQSSRPGASGSGRPPASGRARWQRPSRARAPARIGVLHVRHHAHLAGVGPIHRGTGKNVPPRARGAERAHRGDEAGCHHRVAPGGGRHGLRPAGPSEGVRGPGSVHRTLRRHRVHDVIDISGPEAQKPFVAGTVFNGEPILEIPAPKIRIRLEDTIVVTENGAENVTASTDTRTPRRRAGGVRMKRRGGSRGRTAWPRPREPGTAGYCGPASGLDARRAKRVAHPASANTIARFGPCAKHACGPSSPTSTLD